VHERARRIRGCDRVLVATDDARIAEEVRRLGGEACMTSSAHASGTDRIGEVLATLRPSPGFIVNLQGDEPLLSPRAVERLIEAMKERPDAIWTLADRIATEDEFQRPSVVKVVRARDGRALYFSRSPVPYDRRGAETESDAGGGKGSRDAAVALRHVGVYGYPGALLRAFLEAGPSPLERREGLEQLRALENGMTVRVLLARWPEAAVDTPEDLERLRRRYPTAEALASAGMETEAEDGAGNNT